ncbi:hypothetical protein SBOR_6343 [Sclerotinia borealis F-4128]|uniref:Uncharacterized protein n=1 Tax=Sclerotinia borealis (strain F-4128) TaxID=1432307 RepID=W9CBP6_SCLBF|nr:hypothetical protein SBOR_6343 [Sclerotinia borealis F-4128]
MPKDQPNHSQPSARQGEVGQPELIVRASRQFWKALKLLVFSLVCCAAAVVAVALPEAALWLGSRGNAQLIVVGLAISLMNHCFGSEARTCGLVLEARLGRSTIQNYEAILYNRLSIVNFHRYVRLVIFLLSVFPLTLSVAYKGVDGGETHTNSLYGQLNLQGLFADAHQCNFRLDNPLPDKRATAIMIYVTEPIVTLNTRYPLKLGSYGLNMQVLNHNTTAMLDPPTSDYIQALRQKMFPGQTLYLQASVNATFSSINCTTADTSCTRSAEFLNDSSSSHATWTSTVKVSGNINFTMAAYKDQQVLFFAAWDKLADPPTNFSSEAVGFNLYRGHCDGRWRIDKSTVGLEEASGCVRSDFPGSQRVIVENIDWASLQKLQQVLADAMVTTSDDTIPVIMTTDLSVQSAIVASMMWSKLSSHASETTFYNRYPELDYVTEETLQWSVLTLKREVWLYVIICIQPVMIFIFMIIRYCLRHIPVSNTFGLTSLLAGIDLNSAALLKGASYSGTLNTRVTVTINVVEDGEARGRRCGHLEYVLGTDRKGKAGSLIDGVTYG